MSCQWHFDLRVEQQKPHQHVNDEPTEQMSVLQVVKASHLYVGSPTLMLETRKKPWWRDVRPRHVEMINIHGYTKTGGCTSLENTRPPLHTQVDI